MRGINAHDQGAVTQVGQSHACRRREARFAYAPFAAEQQNPHTLIVRKRHAQGCLLDPAVLTQCFPKTANCVSQKKRRNSRSRSGANNSSPSVCLAGAWPLTFPRLTPQAVSVTKPRKLPRKKRDYGLPQSDQVSALTRANSERFAVINVSLFRIACPAIKRSYAPIGFPMDSRSARIAPAISAS